MLKNSVCLFNLFRKSTVYSFTFYCMWMSNCWPIIQLLFETKVSVVQLKVCSAFTSFLRSVRERISSIRSCTSCIAGRSGPVDRFYCFRYRTISFEILPCVSA